jgi:hypothetical protein
MVLYVALMLLFGFALNYAITAVQPLMPESYPTAIRNTGVAWCQAFARFGGSGSSIVLGAFATVFTMANPALSNPDAVAAAAAAGKELAATIPAWSTVVLTLCIPFALGFICTLVFVKETGGKSMDQLSAEASGDLGDTGTSKFIIMMVIVAFLALMCIVFPLLPAGTFGTAPDGTPLAFAKTAMALPLMATGMLLPFLFFFVFAGPLALKKD